MLASLYVMMARIRAFLGAGKQNRDFQEELEAHLAMLSEAKIRSGMTPGQARRAARVELGGLAQLHEAHRDTRGLPFMDILTQDLRHTFRTLRRDAGFTSFAILIVGLGVGGQFCRLQHTATRKRLTTVPVAQNFFPLLGLQPLLGRPFTVEECRWNGPKAVLLSYVLWKRRYASDPHIAGKTITLNETPVTIAGVLPESFDFGSVFAPGTRVDLSASYKFASQSMGR